MCLPPVFKHFIEVGGIKHWITVGMHANYSEEQSKSYDFDTVTLNKTTLRSSFDLTVRDWDWFLQDRVAFTDQWQMSVALQENRFIRENVDLVDGNQSYDIAESKLDYIIALSFFPNQYHHVFVSYSTSSSFATGQELVSVQRFQ